MRERDAESGPPSLGPAGVGVVGRVAAALRAPAAVVALRAWRQVLRRADVELVAAVRAGVGAGAGVAAGGDGFGHQLVLLLSPFCVPVSYPALVAEPPRRSVGARALCRRGAHRIEAEQRLGPGLREQPPD